MADGGENLVIVRKHVCVELADRGVDGEILHRSVPAYLEHDVPVSGAHVFEFQGRGELVRQLVEVVLLF